MKQFLSILLAVTLTLGALGQTKPYVSVGASLSTNVVTGGLELGLYDQTNNYCIVAETTPSNKTQETYVGFKWYHQLKKVSKSTYLYGFGAMKVHVDHKMDLVFEPGLALVQAFGDHFALQVSSSMPIYENTTLFKPVYLSGGLSLNYNF